MEKLVMPFEGYADWLSDLKSRIQTARMRAEPLVAYLIVHEDMLVFNSTTLASIGLFARSYVSGQ